MTGFIPALDVTRAEKRERVPELEALKPGECSDEARVFRCEHCRKLRHYNEGCDTGHPFVKDPHEDAFLRSLCDYCWYTITTHIEEIRDRARKARMRRLAKGEIK